GRIPVVAPVAAGNTLVVGQADQHAHQVGAVGPRLGAVVTGTEKRVDLGGDRHLRRIGGGISDGGTPAEPLGGNPGLLVQVVLLNIGQNARQPAPVGRDPVVLLIRDQAVDREVAVRVVVGVDGQGELFKVVLALDAGGGLADLLHRGQQQAN